MTRCCHCFLAWSWLALICECPHTASISIGINFHRRLVAPSFSVEWRAVVWLLINCFEIWSLFMHLLVQHRRAYVLTCCEVVVQGSYLSLYTIFIVDLKCLDFLLIWNAIESTTGYLCMYICYVLSSMSSHLWSLSSSIWAGCLCFLRQGLQ